MKSFIYDKYGYSVSNDVTDTFEINDWKFRIQYSEEIDEKTLMDYRAFIKGIAENILGVGFDIIVTREGQLIANSEYGNMFMYASSKREISWVDLVNLHNTYTNIENKNFDLFYIIKLWEDKVSTIEEKSLPAIKIDDYYYQYIMLSAINAIGLAENAIQYLREIIIDYPNETCSLTIAHRRMTSLYTSDFLNPLNFLIDVKSRDYAELYKNNLMGLDALAKALQMEHFTSYEASILFARILFPNMYFDLLEKGYAIRQDIRGLSISFYSKYEEYLQRIKEAHRFLVKTYNIRPISWLK